MKNILLLIIGIIGVATVMFPIFYYPLTDYYTYKAPIKNSIIVPKFTHVDTVFHSDINYKSEHPLFDISIIDDDTIKVSFRILRLITTLGLIVLVGLWRSQVARRTLNPAVVGPNPSRPAYLPLLKIDLK